MRQDTNITLQTRSKALHIQVSAFANETALIEDCTRMCEDFKAGKVDAVQKETMRKLTGGDYNDDGRKWYGDGVNSYTDAVGLFSNGYTKHINAIKAAFDSAKSCAPTVTRGLFYAGACPCVPAVLAGRPRNMHTQVVNVHNRVISVYVDVCASASVGAAQLEDASAQIAAYIGGLQKAGYSVNVHVFNVTLQRGGDNNYSVLDLKVKDANARANISRFMFPLCHPSYLRVFEFIQACCNKHWQGVSWGLGSPLAHEDDALNIIKAILPAGALYLSSQAIINGKSIQSQIDALNAADAYKIKDGAPCRP